MPDLQTGNLVQLPSGGPIMTVLHPFYTPDAAMCAWFTVDGEYRSANILKSVLQLVDKPEKRVAQVL
jgi:uncharacterized protein YodC (DUF2158 family)